MGAVQPIAPGLYYDRLPSRDLTLRELAERAVTAAEADSAALADDLSSEELLCATADDAWDARRALLDRLFEDHGVGRALARKMAEVLL